MYYVCYRNPIPLPVNISRQHQPSAQPTQPAQPQPSPSQPSPAQPSQPSQPPSSLPSALTGGGVVSYVAFGGFC